MNASVAIQSKRWWENCAGKYSRAWKNQSGKHLVNLCESNILETQVSPYSLYCELASRTLFPIQSTNTIQIKITNYRVVGDGYIWESMWLMNMLAESVSVLSSFKCSQW